MIVLLAACTAAPEKKVVVMASGKLTINGDAIKIEPGTTHNEATISVKGDKITVEGFNGAGSFPVTEAGTYLLNLKKDTLIGGYQSFGEASTREARISQEILMERMDSLKQLMVGANVSEARKNNFLAPGQLKKISAMDNAILVGPYKGLPASLEADKEGKVPEVYKFVTNKDARETIGRLEKMLKQ